MPPTVAEIVDLVVRLEDDPARRHLLDGQPHGIFRAAVDEGLVRDDDIGSFAQVVGQAVKQEALGFRAQHGGVILPPPEALWTDHAFQSRIGYYATLAGQQMAALFRQRQTFTSPESSPDPEAELGLSVNTDEKQRDLFICHASEDKDTVVRPLAKALIARGWTVWLDELELTIGDSLSGHIDAALARSRFGVAVLSPASFAKEWPQRELAGLAAREVDAGSKVILPVWHEVDHHYIVQRSPILGDRLGALTSAGIEDVADKVSLALERAGMRSLVGRLRVSVVQSVEPEGTIPPLADRSISSHRADDVLPGLVPAPRSGDALLKAMGQHPKQREQRKQAIKRGNDLLRTIFEAEVEDAPSPKAREIVFYNLAARVEAWARGIGSAQEVERASSNSGADLARLKLLVQSEVERLQGLEEHAPS